MVNWFLDVLEKSQEKILSLIKKSLYVTPTDIILEYSNIFPLKNLQNFEKVEYILESDPTF